MKLAQSKLDKSKVDYSLYLVTDDACLQGRPLLDCVRAALEGGVTLVQHRSKHSDGGPMYQEALQLQELCQEYNVPLIINDRLDVAMAVGAAGVHLGQDDLPCAVARQIAGPELLIGVSAHNVAEAQQAVADGADYLGSGAVFGSVTKDNVGTLGLEGLAKVCAGVDIPVVGIGGVNRSNYAAVLQAGATGAAIVSGILAAEDIKAEVEQIKALAVALK